MISIDYIIDKKLDNIIYALEVFGYGVLPNTAQAVERSADAMVGIWSNIARGVFKHATGRYIHGIEKGKIYPYNNDKFQAAVINTVPYAKYLENGTRAYDLKNMLNTSSKVRVAKDGKRYLIIPFRHGVPGSVEFQPMREEIHKLAQRLSISQRVTKWAEPSQQGAKSYKEAQMFLAHGHPEGKTVERYGYKWGERLTKQMLIANNLVNMDKKSHWKSSKYEGMVRFPRDEGTPGSKYMTFRVMKEDKSGWIKPATPALHIAERAAKTGKFAIQRIIQQGFEEDIKVFIKMYL